MEMTRSIYHDNDNHSSNILEVQLSGMFTKAVSGYMEYLANNAGVRTYDDSFGVDLRIAF